ncbi:hypothetical protein GCM10010398_15210 [Streptomyces fimbriatus]
MAGSLSPLKPALPVPATVLIIAAECSPSVAALAAVLMVIPSLFTDHRYRRLFIDFSKS